jgi:1,4-alpha-glucan branching enzyme
VAAGRAAGRGPALERAARELLALQSSDWAFITSSGLAGGYPRERVSAHRAALDAALAALEDCAAPESPMLRNLAPALELGPLIAA